MRQADRDAEIIHRILEDYDTIVRRVKYFGLDVDGFCNDHSFEGELAYDAVMNPVYRVVEDSIHLSDEVIAELPELPWRDIRGFRNFVAHGYAAIDRRAAWNVVASDLPSLAKSLREYADKHGLG